MSQGLSERGSRKPVISWSPNTVANSVPGRMPMALPMKKCSGRMRMAPATTFTTAKGATGTNRTAVIARMPRRRMT